MSLNPKYRSILEDEADFFEPVRRSSKGKINLGELKQQWDERKEEQITGQKIGEALIKKELGLSYTEVIRKQEAQKKLELESKQQQSLDELDVENQEVADEEDPFMEVIVPKAEVQTSTPDDESIMGDLTNGYLLQRCKFLRKCSKDVALSLIRQSVQIRSEFMVAHIAVESYVLLLTNKSGSGGFLDEEVQYTHEFMPDCSYFLELFAKLGQYDGNSQEEFKLSVIIQQVKNWLNIISTVSTRQKNSLQKEQINQWKDLFTKILMLQLDKQLQILKSDIYKTVKSVIQWLDDDQWKETVKNFSEKLVHETPNLSGIVGIAEKVPILSIENFQDRGQMLKSEICFLAFCKYYPIQKDIAQVTKKRGSGSKRSRDKFEENSSNYLQDVLDIFNQQISAKKLLENFVSEKSQGTDYVLLRQCLYLLEQISSAYVRDYCCKKKKGQEINEEDLQILWNMIDYMKILCQNLQQRRGNDIERLQAKDTASTLQLHSKWNIEQFD